MARRVALGGDVKVEGGTRRRSPFRLLRGRRAAEAAPQAEEESEESLVPVLSEPAVAEPGPDLEAEDEQKPPAGGRRRISLPRIKRGGKPLADRFAFMRADSPVPVYVGILLVLGGFALIGVTWGKVAGLLQVPLQLPYLVSGGLTGLGLIMVGITVISVAAKRRDAAERSRQLDQLAEIMKELRTALRESED